MLPFIDAFIDALDACDPRPMLKDKDCDPPAVDPEPLREDVLELTEGRLRVRFFLCLLAAGMSLSSWKRAAGLFLATSFSSSK